jgi:hypothetical protein
MFQFDVTAVRILLDAAWSMRGSGLVQYITGASW